MKNPTQKKDTFEAYYKKLVEIMEYENCSQSYFDRMETGYKALTKFLKAKEIKDLKDVTVEDIRAYQDYIYNHRTKHGKPYTISSQITLLSCVTCLFRRLVNAKVLPFNPASQIKLPRRVKKLPNGILDKSEVKKLLEAPHLDTPNGFRDRTILEVFLCCAPRIQEMCDLRLDNVDFENGMITIRKGKWRKDRVAPLGSHATAFLKEYVENVRPHLVKTNTKDHLFVSRFGGAMSRSGVHCNLQTLSKKAKVRNVNAHFFRYTLGTWMLQKGVDLRSIQMLLGLDNLNTVQQYAMVISADLKKVHKKTHPRCQVDSSDVKYTGDGDLE